MPPKKSIDEAALLKMIADGISQKELLSRFEFRSPTQLKVAYLNALIGAGKVQALNTGRTSSAGPINDTIIVNQRGSLIVPKALVTHLGLQTGDMFDVTKTDAGLALYSRRRPNR